MKTLVALLWALIASIGMAFAAVNVNTATRAELEKLHGIGPVKAQAIIDYREKNGPFRSLEDLDKVPGIGQGTIDKMRDDVTFSGRTTGVADERASSGSTRGGSASTAETARERTGRAAERASEKTQRTAESAQDKTERAASKAKDKTERTAEKAKEKAESAASKAKDKAQRTADKAKDTAAGGPLDINSASAQELAELPGIGKSRAAAIVKHRPYRSMNELVDRKVIPQGAYDQVKDRIVARRK
jgi:competence protein ComEA